jgi:cytochrome c peroxidase
MKKSYVLLIFVLATVITFIASLAIGTKERSMIERPLKDWLAQKQEDVQTSLVSLKEIALKLDKKEKSLKKLKQAFLNSRISYKQVEVIAAYLDPYNAWWLNAAAVPKIEYEKLLPKVTKPRGFQILEEMLFSGEEINKQEVLKEVDFMMLKAKDMKSVINQYELEDWMVFDALRQSIIRIMSMGVTGFDSPIALNSIKETKAVCISILELVRMYETHLIDDKEGFTILRNHMTLAVEYLDRNDDFDSFDRAYFIRTLMDPCFAASTQLQESLMLELKEQRYDGFTAYNPYAKSLFSNDFLKKSNFQSFKTAPEPPKQLVELGKMLFNDPILSDNNRVSCATCHRPDYAFAEPKKLSTHFNQKEDLARNAPTLLNSIYQRNFQLDGRADRLEEQFHQVITSKEEMNKSESKLLHEINTIAIYKDQFKRVFPAEGSIDFSMVKTALLAYTRSLASINSSFDRYMRREEEEINQEVINGFNLFMGKGKCATCHFPPVFNGLVPPTFKESESEVIGVPATKDTVNPKIDPDEGRYIVASVEEHKYSFKTPTVRNSELTAPYMHNGVYETLEEVLDFYNKGGGVGMGMDIPNQTLPPDKLNLKPKEISDIITFMKALTDTVGYNYTQKPK